MESEITETNITTSFSEFEELKQKLMTALALLSENFQEIEIKFIDLSPYENISKLLIQIYYEKNSKFNPTDETIIFYVEINQNFPKSKPKITCHSNFEYPSLYDNRDLIDEFFYYNFDAVGFLTDLIAKNIPSFTQEFMNTISDYICVYNGSYYLNQPYTMNDFAENPNNHFVKGKEKGKIVFFVVTDIYLLKLTSHKATGNAYLDFYGELVKVDSMKILSNSIPNSPHGIVEFVIKMNYQAPINEAKFFMPSGNYQIFCYFIEERKKQLFKFSYFYSSVNITTKNIIDLIGIYEDKLEKENNPEIKNKLFKLYSKAIELCSSDDMDKYSEYTNKLARLFNS